MKNYCLAFIIFLTTGSLIFANEIAVPSVGDIILSSSSINKGRLLLRGQQNMYFQPQSTLKGEDYTSVTLRLNVDQSLAESLESIARTSPEKQLIILGEIANGELNIKYRTGSIMGHNFGTDYWRLQTDVEKGERIVASVLEYERLSARDENLFVEKLLREIKNPGSVDGVVAYLTASRSTLTSNNELRSAVINSVTGLVVKGQTNSLAVAEAMATVFSDYGPESLSLEFLQKILVQENNPVRGAARNKIASILKNYVPFTDDRANDIQYVRGQISAAMPRIRESDGIRLLGYLDSTNSNIVQATEDTLEQIYIKTVPSNLRTLAERKEFWTSEIQN